MTTTYELPSPALSGKITVNQKDIYWEFFGDIEANRETVCVTNGIAMRTASWYGILPFLSGDFNIVLYDYPGQGNSACEDEKISIPYLGYYLYRILNELSIDKIHIMGMSYGAFVAFDFARLYGERLHSLIISGGYLQHPVDIESRLYSKMKALDENNFSAFVDNLFSELFGSDFKENDVYKKLEHTLFERYNDKFYCLKRLFEAQKEFVDNLNENHPFYRMIDVPAYIIAGEHDIVFPVEHQRKITEIIPQTRFDVVKDAGHLVYMQKSADFFSRVKHFMRMKSVNW